MQLQSLLLHTDLHTHRSALIRSNSAPDGKSVEFKQEFVLAPPLFNVCLDSMSPQLLPQLQQLGIAICYEIGNQSNNLTEELLMWTLLNADDISLACNHAGKLKEAVITMGATFLRWGLTISTKKTKVLVVGRVAAAQAADSVMLYGNQLEVMSHFEYLGSVFTSECILDAETPHQVAAADSVFQQLRLAHIWSSGAFTLSVEMQFCKRIVKSFLLYSGTT